MMLGLRINEGVSETAFYEAFGVTLRERYDGRLEALRKEGLIRRNGDRWALTRRGMDVQNTVLVRLMD